jgi:hypothetical protein
MEFDNDRSQDGMHLKLHEESPKSISMEELHAMTRPQFRLQSEHWDNVMKNPLWSMNDSDHSYLQVQFDEREELMRLKILQKEANEVHKLLYGTLPNAEFVHERISKTYPYNYVEVIEVEAVDLTN